MEPKGPTITTHHFIAHRRIPDSRPAAIRRLITSLSIPGRPISLDKAFQPVPRTTRESIFAR